MKNNLAFCCVIFLLLSGCAGDKILNPLEKRLSGQWIEIRERKGLTPSISESYHFLTDRSFTDRLTSNAEINKILRPGKWYADNNELFLTYRLSRNSILGWLLSPLEQPISLKIKGLTDSTALFESQRTGKYPSHLIVLKKAKLNGKYTTE